MRKGFTLIELLVTMALLAMIVMAVSKAFQQSTIAWDTGWRRVESIMVGRAITDYMVREIAKTVYDPNGSLDPERADPQDGDYFVILDGTNGLYQLKYRSQGSDEAATLDRIVAAGAGRMFKNNDRLQIRNFNYSFKPSGEDPVYAEIDFDVWSKDKGIEHTMKFKTRAFLANKYRYYHESPYEE